ncbi:MAG: putative bifunctional diguanylate cyclase/phosphodiesterase [Ilumatobacteraceae bacterium]
MKRASTLLTWWYLAVGGALTAASFAASDSRVRLMLLAVAAVALLAAIADARIRGALSLPLSLLSASAVLCFAVSRLIAGGGSPAESLPSVLLGVAAYGIAAAALLLLLIRRGVQPRDGLGGDVVIVALATWVVSWPAIALPIIHAAGVGPATVLHALHLPLAAVVLFLAGTLLLDTGNRSLSLWLLAGGLALQALSHLVDDLIDAGNLSSTFDRLAVPLAIAAAVSAGAAYLHPSLSELGEGEPTEAREHAPGHFVVTIASLAFPVIVLGATDPTGTADKVVRTVSAVALATAVMLRVLRTLRGRSHAAAAVLHDARTDTLTDLPNRGVLLQQVEHLLGQSWRHDQHPALLFVDLDRFKHINDSLGHSVGDEALITVARRLREYMPAEAVVARISGDEYAILDPTPTSHDAAMDVAEQLLAVIGEPLALSCGDVFITASIGVAAISQTSRAADEPVRHADVAMYRAKQRGGNCVEAYDDSIIQRASQRHAMETALHRAVDRDELRLYHQPIVDLATGDVEGFEALMRWQQADGTVVSPAEFIPIAEETGTIVRLGSWALLEALSTLREWVAEGICKPTATMSVNVSAVQLREANFPDAVNEALTRAGVAPSSLWLEVTESSMIKEPEVALDTLRRLSELGVRIALDDFGTGYSSLSMLQQFPLHRIKIDRSFVRDLATADTDRGLVNSIILMARALELDVVAEGVETVTQWDELKRLACPKAQGYLLSRPVPPDAMRSTVAGLEQYRSIQRLAKEASNN